MKLVFAIIFLCGIENSYAEDTQLPSLPYLYLRDVISIIQEINTDQQQANASLKAADDNNRMQIVIENSAGTIQTLEYALSTLKPYLKNGDKEIKASATLFAGSIVILKVDFEELERLESAILSNPQELINNQAKIYAKLGQLNTSLQHGWQTYAIAGSAASSALVDGAFVELKPINKNAMNKKLTALRISHHERLDLEKMISDNFGDQLQESKAGTPIALIPAAEIQSFLNDKWTDK